MGLQTTVAFRIDAQGNPLNFDIYGLEPITKSMTFAGGTTNDPGDVDGTGNPATLFTVTGNVSVALLPYCTTDLAGASATLEIGTTKDINGLVAQTTATNIDANEIWHDATPDADIEALTVIPERAIINGGDIIQTVATANITSGVIEYALFWRPLTTYAADGVTASSVVAA